MLYHLYLVLAKIYTVPENEQGQTTTFRFEYLQNKHLILALFTIIFFFIDDSKRVYILNFYLQSNIKHQNGFSQLYSSLFAFLPDPSCIL